MRRLLRLLKYFAWTAVSLVVLGMLTLLLLLTTEPGSRWIVSTAIEQSGVDVSVRGTEGTLWRGMQFERIAYVADSQTVSVDRARIRVRWGALTMQSLAIDTVEAAEVRIESNSPEPDSPEPLTIDVAPLPVAISLRSGSVESVVLARPNSETRFTNLEIRRARWAGNELRCADCAVAIDSARIQLLQLRTTLSGDVPFTADIAWSFGDVWWGTGSLRRSLASLEVKQAIAGSYSATVDATLRLIGRTEPDYNGTALVEVPFEGQAVAVSAQFEGDVRGLRRITANAQYDEFEMQADGALRWEPELEFSGSAALHAGPNFVSVNGNLQQETVDASWEVSAPHASLLLPALTGTVTGEGRLSGSPIDPTLAGQLNVADATFGNIAASFDGSLESTRVRLQWSRDSARAQLAGQVRRSDAGISARIESAEIQEERAGVWRLASATDFKWQAEGAGLSAHSWVGELGELNVQRLDWRPGELNVRASADQLPLNAANPFLPNGFELLGTATADIDATFGENGWQGRLVWKQSDSKLLVANVYQEVDSIDIERVDVQATFDDRGIEASAQLDMPAGIRASLNTTLDAPSIDAPVDARLTLEGDSWDWVSALVPEIDRLEGRLAGALSVSGTLAEPMYAGEITFSDGALAVPALAVPLNAITVNAEGSTDNRLEIHATANAGGGNIEARGEIREVLSNAPQLQVTIKGDNAEILNWPEYRVWASPDTEIRWQEDQWTFAGNVGIPRARIAVREVPKEAILPSPDAIVLGEVATPTRDSRVAGSTEIVFGEDVLVDVLGLRARLGGRVRLTLRAERPPAATGRVSIIDGTFSAYGRELAIREGTLTFTGPLDDPIVDVTATRQIETIDGEVLAGVRLTGTAQELTTTLFSEPAMAEADALSYLLIGRPVSQATQSEGGELSNAAFGLGLNQASRITEQIGQAIGLDELSLVGENDDSATLIAGKRINSRLYARYTFGAFSHLGTLLLRYKLSRRLTIEAGTGESQSIDVLYSVEKD